jgi:hypothetical protein
MDVSGGGPDNGCSICTRTVIDFAVAAPETQARQDHVTFVFNFFDELRRIAPAAKQ